jgi:hypothetical protein
MPVDSRFRTVPQGPARDKLLAKRAARRATATADELAALADFQSLPVEEQHRLRIERDTAAYHAAQAALPAETSTPPPPTEELQRIVEGLAKHRGIPVPKIVRITPSTGPSRYDDARPPPPEVELVNGADIEPAEVSWLWSGWLQRGVFNLLVGRSTAGKSTIALSLAATATNSDGLWPDNQPNHDPGHVLYWSGEDGIRDTLLPRFLAAGGTPRNITFIGGIRQDGKKRAFNPAKDMESLARAAEKLRNLRLVVLDPVALMIAGDSHKNVETRVGLQPLVDLCAGTSAAGLGVHHFSKSTKGGDPLDRVSGSLAFGARPRCVLLAARDLYGGENAKRALMRPKVSNGRDWGGFDYMLDRRPLDGWPAIKAQLVLWGAFIDRSARDVLGQYEDKPAGIQQRKAVLFLTTALANGPRLAKEMLTEAETAGITERTLRRAFKELGGIAERKGYGGIVTWALSKATVQ